jgi:hypothetical protein
MSEASDPRTTIVTGPEEVRHTAIAAIGHRSRRPRSRSWPIDQETGNSVGHSRGWGFSLIKFGSLITNHIIMYCSTRGMTRWILRVPTDPDAFEPSHTGRPQLFCRAMLLSLASRCAVASLRYAATPKSHIGSGRQSESFPLSTDWLFWSKRVKQPANPVPIVAKNDPPMCVFVFWIDARLIQFHDHDVIPTSPSPTAAPDTEPLFGPTAASRPAIWQ